MRLLLSFALLAWSLQAQTATIRWFGTTGDVVLAAAGTKATIQQPATLAKSVALETAVVYCSVACDVTQAQNGTAASTTAGTLVPITNSSGSPVTKFWTASNVGAGTAAGGILHLAAGAILVIDLSKISLLSSGVATTNYTVIISSITGTANITFYGSEK